VEDRGINGPFWFFVGVNPDWFGDCVLSVRIRTFFNHRRGPGPGRRRHCRCASDHPFYERYKFENDSTLAVETLEGEKFDKVKDVTRFELKDGQFGGGGEGARWVATSIGDKSITFEPVAKARNSFRWERESENSWKAILSWPATDKAPAGQRTYQMERWPKQ
jgi:hypothetical protein